MSERCSVRLGDRAWTFILKTISGPNLLTQYLRLREQGWKTLWTGEGKICLIKVEKTKGAV